MAYEAKILADSITPNGHRLTTFCSTFPRIVLAEVNTHCMLARNSASSRAVPVAKKIAQVQADPFVPEAFGKNMKGMQHGEMLDDEGNRLARRAWQSASHEAIRYAGELAGLDVHKQLANRVVEPFAWHTAIITATDWGNFWNLRVSPHAQGEFRTCAAMMKELYDVSTPHKLRRDEWHLPLVPELDGEIFARDEVRAALSPEQWLWWAKISAARCARVSYNTHEGKRDIDEDEALFEKLIAPGHMSPLEHTARPMSVDELTLVRAWDISLVNGPTLRVRGEGWANLRIGDEVDLAFDRSRPVKIARIRGPLHYAGKFDGWISLRSMVHGEEDIIGYRASQA